MIINLLVVEVGFTGTLSKKFMILVRPISILPAIVKFILVLVLSLTLHFIQTRLVLFEVHLIIASVPDLPLVPLQ